ncbi:hypothetical protein A9320_07995 [Ruegeria sp. PBVC088]|nr:hypothetical protein A9320_07995 [Ruegeria sp. PBVC088]
MKAWCGAVIEVTAEHALTGEDEAQIAALLRASFPTDFGGRSFFQQRPHLRVVWRDGMILGHVALFYRAIRVDGQLIDVIGLGDVATAPEARGRGIATSLLDRVLAIGKDSNAQFALLFGERRLYDRAGFRLAANTYIRIDMTGARTGDVARVQSRFLRVLPLTGALWSDRAELDLLGPLF